MQLFGHLFVLYYAWHKHGGGAYCFARFLETIWCDIKDVVAKIIGYHWTIKDLDEIGKQEDDIVLDAINAYPFTKHFKIIML